MFWELSQLHLGNHRHPEMDGSRPAAPRVPGELLKFPEPSSALDRLNHRAWGWGPGIDFILKAAPGDTKVQPGSRGIPGRIFRGKKKSRSPLEWSTCQGELCGCSEDSNVAQKLTFEFGNI